VSDFVKDIPIIINKRNKFKKWSKEGSVNKVMN
jgi:hypothetical protein